MYRSSSWQIPLLSRYYLKGKVKWSSLRLTAHWGESLCHLKVTLHSCSTKPHVWVTLETIEPKRNIVCLSEIFENKNTSKLHRLISLSSNLCQYTVVAELCRDNRLKYKRLRIKLQMGTAWPPSPLSVCKIGNSKCVLRCQNVVCSINLWEGRGEIESSSW